MGDSEVPHVDSCRWMDKAINVILTDPQILDCFICCEPLSVPVFQCENGHVCCSTCCTKVHNTCPSCSLPIGHIRCRAIEMVMESIMTPCPNRIYGCTMVMNLNLINHHKSTCTNEPFSCPLSDCSYVGSTKQLASHFNKQHNDSVKRFSYNSRFKIYLNNGDTYRIFQAQKDGVLFILSCSIQGFGNALTVNRIGCSLSDQRKLCYEIKAKAPQGGSVLSFQSVAKEIQGWTEVHPSKGSLLIPNDYFGSFTQTILEFRIWPAC